MAKFYLLFRILCLAAFASNVANAAEITVVTNEKPTPEVGKIIEITGEITTGDDLRLIAALHNAPPNTLI